MAWNIYVFCDVDYELVHVKHVDRELLVFVRYQLRRGRGERLFVNRDRPVDLIIDHAVVYAVMVELTCSTSWKNGDYFLPTDGLYSDGFFIHEDDKKEIFTVHERMNCIRQVRPPG